MSSPRNSLTPNISVIIPSYNYANFLGRALKSVLDQTYSNFELIIVDDGSEDNTSEVVNQFKDDRIRYHQQDNRGLSAARNTGIQLSQGGYLAFLDADDEWYQGKLQAQLDVIKDQPQVGLVFCHCEYVDKQGNILEVVENHRRGKLFLQLLRANFITGTSSSMLIRRTCFSKLGGFSEKLTSLEDWHMAARIAAYWEIDYANQVLVRITSHPSSMSKNLDRMKANTFETLALLETEFMEIVPDKVWRQARSYAYLTMGRVYAMNGYFVPSRRLFWQALQTDPGNVAVFPFLFASLLGPKVYSRLRSIKRTATPDLGT